MDLKPKDSMSITPGNQGALTFARAAENPENNR